MMIVAHNLLAMNGNRMLGINSDKKAKNTEKLSSGYRVNRSADDAAGLAISEKMRRQIRGLNQGLNNIQDGISVCQIMDGSLNEAHEIMHRMTELSVKAANGTLNAEDREAIQKEINELVKELDNTTGSSLFNEKPLLRAREGVDIHIDAPSNPNAGKADVVFLIDNTGSMGSYINNVKNNLSTFADALSNCNVQYGVVEYGDVREANGVCKSSPFMTSTDEVIQTLNQINVDGGGDFEESSLEAVMEALNYPFREDATKELVLVTDATFHYSGDGKEGASSLTVDQVNNAINAKGVRVSAVTSDACRNRYQSTIVNGDIFNISGNFHDSLTNLAGQIASAAGETIHKSPDDIIIKMSGAEGDTFTVHTYNASAAALGISDLSCLTQENAEQAIDKIHKALGKVSAMRSQIGADQNGLEHGYRVNANVEENTEAAEARIRDTEMDDEMLEFSKNALMEQVSQAMLAQTNQTPQGVLTLLQ